MADTIKPAHHAWDHLAGGEDPIPGFGSVQWARIEGTSTASVSNNTLTTITWLTYAIDPKASAFSINTSTAPIKILLPGWYVVEVDFEWNASGYTDNRYYEVTGGVSDNFLNGNVTGYFTDSGDYESGAQYSFLSHYQGGSAALALKVKQTSGVSKDVNTASLSIVYLGPGGGIDDGSTLMDDIRVNF